MDIKNIYDAVIFTSVAVTLRDAVVDAIQQKINLSYANLRYADLIGANLSYADLIGANLRSADLIGAKNITDKLAIAQFQFIPTDGPFIGWKKCKNEVIVKLCISTSAQRSHGTERRCRASQVKVLEVFGASEGISSYDPSVIYRKGKIVKCVEPFDENRWYTYASGIHFYLTREEAEAH